MELNKNIIVLSQDDKLVLKIGNSDKIIKLSQIELDILKYYTEVNDNEKVIIHFSEQIKIDTSILELLIDIAIKNKIITENEENEKKSAFKFVFKLNKRIFEIFNLDFTSTKAEKIFENRLLLHISLILLFLSAFYFVFEISKSPLNFSENYKKTLYSVSVPFTQLITYIYLASFISTFFHEIGHYFFYKYFKGKTSMFGFGLLFFFLPVFYNKIIVSMIKKKNQKIIINFGGIIFDILFLLFIIFFTKYYYAKYPILSFIAYSSMISICIRSFFNLNIFLPNTDGYFIFSEIINKPKILEDSISNSIDLFKNRKITFSNVFSLVFTLLSYLSMAISWLFFFIPFLIYFYYAFSQ